MTKAAKLRTKLASGPSKRRPLQGLGSLGQLFGPTIKARHTSLTRLLRSPGCTVGIALSSRRTSAMRSWRLAPLLTQMRSGMQFNTKKMLSRTTSTPMLRVGIELFCESCDQVDHAQEHLLADPGRVLQAYTCPPRIAKMKLGRARRGIVLLGAMTASALVAVSQNIAGASGRRKSEHQTHHPSPPEANFQLSRRVTGIHPAGHWQRKAGRT